MQSLSSTLGNFTGVIVGVLAMVVIGRLLLHPSAVAPDSSTVTQ